MKKLIFLTVAFFFWAVPLFGEKPAQSGSSSSPAAATGTDSKKAEETRNRVKELIKLINSEPNLLTINPKADVVKDPNWKPVSPDGKRNQDFKVVPDDSAPGISNALYVDLNRERWTRELIQIGRPAVPDLTAGSLDGQNTYRDYLIYALGQIKDLKGAPAILKYYSDAIDQGKVADSIERMGDKAEADRIRQEVSFKKTTALNALKTLSGQDFGDDYSKWDNWWKATEKKIGKVELPVLYEIQGAKPKKANPAP